MSELYRISGSGYHDWEKMISVAPDDYQPVAPHSAKPENSKRVPSTALAPLALFGCSSPPGPSGVCEKDSDPSQWPSAGSKPRYANDPQTVIIDKLSTSDLDKGVDVVWQFPVANCDGKTDRILVSVYFPDGKQDYQPDPDTKQVTISKNITRANIGSEGYYQAELTYWDPINLTTLTKYFRLWQPQFEDDLVVRTKCDYSRDPNSGGGFFVPTSVNYNQTADLLAWPKECDDTTDSLEVSFLVKGRYYPAPAAGDGFKLPFTFDETGSIPIAAYAKDTSRGSTVIQIENTTKSTYVKPNEASIDIYAKPVNEDNKMIAYREIELQAGYASNIPANALNFVWEVKDPNGGAVQLQSVSGQNVRFTPQMDGIYTAKLTVNGVELDTPIVKFGTVSIYPFSAPDVAISGDQNPGAGDTKNYKALLLPKDRQLGTEDTSAICTWKLFHIDPATNQTVVDRDNVVQNCANNSLSIDFPNTLISQTAYTLQLDVAGASDSYKVRKFHSITAYPSASQRPSADFTVSYASDPIPFRQINFNGILVNGGTGNYNYNWEIKDNLGNLVTTLSGQSPNNSYEFNRSGIYQVTLSIVPEGETESIAKSSQSLIIYPFPKPTASIAINDNNVVYSGKEVPLFAYLDNNRPEDQNATYAWKITHKGWDAAQNKFTDIVDLDPSQPQAQSPFLLFNFNESKTYTVELTVTGMHNGEVAYVKTTTKLLDVFSPWNGLPSATISSNLKYSYHQGDTVNGVNGNSDDPGASYLWTITDPDGGVSNFNNKTLPAIQFSKTGSYFFKLEVTGSDGITKNFSYRSVDVYPSSTFIPSVGISGPYSAHAGDAVNLSGNSDDATATYSWTITPPSGPIQIVNSKSLPNFQLNQVGDWDFKLTVSSADGSVQNSKIHSISVYPPVNSIPSAVISSNLKYSYHQGDSATNISGYSDDINATYKWTITKPDGTFQTVIGQTIASFNFSLTGDYDFKLEVTGSDGETKNYELRSVSVYPAAVQTPQAGIIAPFAGKVGQPVNFVAANPNNGLYTYSWDYNDGTTGTGSVPSPKTFAQAGTYTVMLTVARQDDPTVKDTVTQKITIVPVAIDPPALSMTAPDWARVGSPVNVSVASPDNANWNYSWNFGDGSAIQNGTSASRSYASSGTYTIELTAVSKADPNVKYIITRTISIVGVSINPPSFKLTIPYAAEEGTNVLMSIANVDPAQWDISWNFGDGGTAVGANTNHTYASSGKDQILCTLTSKVDPNIQIVTPFVITIIPHGDPVPNLTVTPGMGKAPLLITANASTSYATGSGASITNYRFNWGDGSAEENGAASSRTHNYSCANSSCGYTIRLTVTDSNGKTSTITATVSTWQ